MKKQKDGKKKANKKVILGIIISIVAVGVVAAFFLTREQKVPEVTYEGYVARFGWEEVAQKNTLMSGFTVARGEAMGFEQVDTLVLNSDNTFEMTKELRTTITTAMMSDPVSVKFVFKGTYTQNGDTVQLSKAQSAYGTVDWGTLSNYMDTGNGEFDSKTSPGILSYYPTAFYVERAKNVPMTVHIDETNKTFIFEEFEPEILSHFEAGKITPNTSGGNVEKEAGLMKEPLVKDTSAYSLKDTYDGYGMKVGTCINTRSIKEPYEDILLEQFSSVTFENALKPERILDQKESIATGKLSVTFSEETKQLLDWCKKNKMSLRGHTLIWYMSTPDWIFREGFDEKGEYVDREKMLIRMEDFIKGFFDELNAGGWAECMYCLDVVNEAIVAPDEMREFPWQQIIGDDYVWYAFHYANKYAPEHIALAYNDFDLEAKTDKVISLVNSLVEKDGTKMVDVIGQQGHYGAYSDVSTLAPALEKIYKETGCEIQVTELDVNISKNGAQDELKHQGQFYYNFAQEMLALQKKGVKITGITLWGFTDAVSWMPNNYMHIYDKNLVEKYAYFGLLGLKEYAGFDLKTDNTEVGGYAYCFTVDGDETKYIELFKDGTFIDTTTGTKIEGTYRFDGDKTFTLIPKVGSYVSLVLSDDAKTADRVEAAGNTVTLKAK